MKTKLLFCEVVAALSLIASSCSPDLTLTQATANWNNEQQSASFVLVNNGMKTTTPFELQIVLLDASDAVVAVAYQKTVNGLGSGEKLEEKQLSLRHMLDPGREYQSKVAKAVFLADAQNVIQELDEENNRKAVRLPPIYVACDKLVRFEGLSPGIEFTPISHIASDGMGFAISALTDNSDFATVRRLLNVGHGQLLWLNNVWLQPKLSTPLDYLAFDAGHFGGEIYLEVNGDTGASPYPEVAAIDGITIGGVAVEVSGDAENPGVWHFKGEIRSFKVGGKALAIDNLLFWKQPNTIIS